MSSVIKADRVVVQQGAAASAPDGDRSVAPEAAKEPSIHSLVQSLLNWTPLQYYAAGAARDVLRTARRDAEEIVQRAEGAREEIFAAAREEGYAAGYDAGLQEGRGEGRAELHEQRELLEKAVQGVAEAKDALLHRHRDELVILAVKLAGKLLRRTGGLDEETARRLLEEMLPRTRGSRSVVVKLNDNDLAALRPELDELAAGADLDAAVEFVPDERLPSGSVYIETERGALDGTEAARARRMTEHLLGVMAHED